MSQEGVRDSSVQSVDRAISILQVLARRRTAGVTDISQELAIHKSTVSRLIGTLEARGLVEQAANRGAYRLAFGVALLAQGISEQHDLTMTSRTVCRTLADEVGETVNVAVCEGGSIVTIDQVMGSAQVTSVNWVGRHQALHSTAAGKVFLSEMPAADVKAYLDGPLERFTELTIVDPAKMLADLAVIRERGYSIAMEEQEVGLVAVAAPVQSFGGGVIAALIVSGPTFRIHDDSIPGIAARVISAAGEISARNGYPKAG